jgi:cyclophilin family peptidyl-prolyl cis-trans isomerase
MRSRLLPIIFGLVLLILVGLGIWYNNRHQEPAPTSPAITATTPAPTPSVAVSGAPLVAATASNPNPDLTTDPAGLSKATVTLTTSRGVVRFKFYPKDAPNTVKRLIELINSGFYNGLIFHRVEPGFVIQGGDPTGTGEGGSGQKLKAEFSDRRHIEGTLAMARGRDPDSADSQFYITLGTFPHLDRNYTVFGQVIEGMDVAKQIQRGDKIVTMRIE